MQEVQIASDHIQQRWDSIVRALVASNIRPDLVTLAALIAGTEVLTENLGLQKRAIGFTASRGER